MKKILILVLLAIAPLVNSQSQGLTENAYRQIQSEQIADSAAQNRAVMQTQSEQQNFGQQQAREQQVQQKRMTCQLNYSACSNGEPFLGDVYPGPFCRAFSQKQAGDCAIERGGMNAQCVANILLNQPGQCFNLSGTRAAVLNSCSEVLNSKFQECMQNPSLFMTRASYMQFCTTTYNNCLSE